MNKKSLFDLKKVPFEEGFYPFFHNSYNGCFYLDENENIVAMQINRDNSLSEEFGIDLEEMVDIEQSYAYTVYFRKPLKSVKFVKRECERNKFNTPHHSAIDIWRLNFADGGKAVLLHTISNSDTPVVPVELVLTESIFN